MSADKYWTPKKIEEEPTVSMQQYSKIYRETVELKEELSQARSKIAKYEALEAECTHCGTKVKRLNVVKVARCPNCPRP